MQNKNLFKIGLVARTTKVIKRQFSMSSVLVIMMFKSDAFQIIELNIPLRGILRKVRTGIVNTAQIFFN